MKNLKSRFKPFAAVRRALAVVSLLAGGLIAGQGCSTGPVDSSGSSGGEPVGKTQAALGELCPLVPPEFINANDGCDCSSDGDTTCDPDCADGNGGGAYCGCDYCYRDPNAGACSYIASQYIGAGDGCDCPQNGDTSCDPDCAEGNTAEEDCGCEFCNGPETVGLSARPSFAEPTLLDSTEVGALPGGGAAASGAYTYSIPIDTLKGRAGMEPALSLVYSSSAGDGIVGRGWSLSGAASYIHRCPRINAAGRQTERLKFDTTDKFCLDGQRLLVTAGQYGAANSEYRTEFDTFTKVVLTGVTGAGTNFEPTGFTVYYKDGRIGTFVRGQWTLARDVLNGNGSVASSSVVTMLWPRTKLEDRRNNAMDYVYERSADTHGTHIPRWIEYTTCSSGTCDYPSSRKRKVEFLYETRPANDTQDGYVNGVRTRTTKRLKTIEVSIANASGTYELVRSYSIRYVQSAVTGRSLVKGVKLCDAGAGTVKCLPETTFVWQGESAIPFTTTTGPQESLVKLRTGVPSSLNLAEENSIAVFDANGDGNDDVLVKYWPLTTLPPATPNSIVSIDRLYLGQGNHTFAAPIAVDPDGDGVAKANCFGSEVMDPGSAQPVDLDSDGRTELIVALNTACPWVTAHPTPTTNLTARIQPGGNSGMSPETNAQRVYGVLAWDPTKGTLTKMAMPGIDGESWNGTEIRMGDMNGDGFPDLLKAAPSNAGWSLRFAQASTRAGFLPQVAFTGTATIPMHVEPNTNTPDFRPRTFGMIDEWGDGRAELVQMDYAGKRRTASLSASGTQLNYSYRETLGAQATSEQGTALSGAVPPTWSAPVLDLECAAPPCPSDVSGAWKFADVNGDGLKDALYAQGSEWRLRINTGTGYAPHQVVSALAGYPVDARWEPKWGVQITWVFRTGIDVGMRIADMNGDGRDDLVLLEPFSGDVQVWSDSGYIMIFADLRVAYSNGTTFATPVSLGGQPNRLHGGGRGYMTQIGDTNGDGLPDIVDVDAVVNDATKRRIVVRSLQMSAGWGGIDIIKQVSDERGVAERISYDTLSKGSNLRPSSFTTANDTHRHGLLDDWANTSGYSDCRYPALCSGKGSVVRRYENLRSARPIDAYFRYWGARVDVAGRGFLGFHAVEQKDGVSATEFFDRYDPVPHSGTATGDNGPGFHLYPKMLVPTVSSRFEPGTSPSPDLSAATVPPISTTWFTQNYDFYPLRLTHFESDMAVREPNSPTNARRFTSASDYDGHGNQTSLTEVATAGTSEYKVVRTTLYANSATGNDPATWIIGLPTRVTETTSTKDDAFGTGCAPSATPCATSTRRTDLEYDRGLLQKVIREPQDTSQDGLKVTREFVRNAAGVITTAKTTSAGTGSVTRQEGIVHDESGVNVIEVTNAVGHKTWFYHHARHNFLYAITDQNGTTTTPNVRVVHDKMGRLRVRTNEDGHEISVSYGVGKIERTLTEVAGAPFSPSSAVFFDARGRRVLKTWTTFGVTSEKSAVEETVYNSLGLVSQKRYAGSTSTHGQLSQNESTARAALTNATQTSAAAYDTLGRITSETAGLNETTTRAYQSPLGTTLVTDPQGNQRSTFVDQNGRVRTLKQFLTNPTKTITTTYGYDDQGNVGHIKSPDNARTVLVYDRLGRMTEWRQHHSSGGSVLHRKLTYSSFDEVLTQAHGRTSSAPAVKVSFLRDRLGRVTERRDMSTGATEAQSFVWDLDTGAIGQLSLATTTYAGAPDETHRTQYVYNAIGQMVEQRERFRQGGVEQDLSMGVGYDSRGRVSSIRYPETSENDDVSHPSTGGLTVAYRYQNGQLSGIDAGGTALWDVRDRHAYGFLKAAKPNASVTMNWERDPNTLRLSRHHAMQGTTVLTNQEYRYYSNGLLRERKHDTMDEDFTYDSLARLKTFERRLGATLITAATHNYTDAGDISSIDTTTATAQSPDWTNTDESYTYSATRPNLIATQTVGTTTTTFRPDDANRIWRHTVNDTTTREYSYTSFDLPKTITLPTENKTVRFKYNADGARVRKTTTGPGGASVDIVSLGETYEQRTSVSGGTTTGESVFRIPGEDGFLAEIVHPWTPNSLGTRVTRHLMNDHQGTPVRTITGTTVSGGTLVGTFPFGKKMGSAASTGIGYTGHIADDDLGLVNMKGRIYDVSQRRFITRDPMLGTPFDAAGANHYAYVLNNPTNLVDPTGFAQELSVAELAARQAQAEAAAKASADAAAAIAQSQAQAHAQANAQAHAQVAQAGAQARAQTEAQAQAQRDGQAFADREARNAQDRAQREASERGSANAAASAASSAGNSAAASGAGSNPQAAAAAAAASAAASAPRTKAPESDSYRERHQDRAKDSADPGNPVNMTCREIKCVDPGMAPAEYVRRAIGYAIRAQWVYDRKYELMADGDGVLRERGETVGHTYTGVQVTEPAYRSTEGDGVAWQVGASDPNKFSYDQLHHSHLPRHSSHPSDVDVHTSHKLGAPVTTHRVGSNLVNLTWQDSSGVFYQTFIPLNYRGPGMPEF